MESKKFLAVMLSVLLVIGVLAGCSKTEGNTAASKLDPKKEITLVVPFSPGGATDLMARQLQPIFKSQLGVNLVVKNVEGGGSAVGITEVATAKPDGYTVGLATSSFISLAAQGRISIGMADTVNISSLSEDPLVLVVKAGGKYNDVASYIKAAKEAPGKITVGQPGTNNANHAFAVLMGKATGAEIKDMPFDGASRVITEIIGEHIDAGVMKPADCMSQLKAGQIKIIGTFTRERVSVIPDVPTFAELGYDVFPYGDIKMVSYIMAPKGLDPAIRAELADMFKKAISSAEFQKIASDSAFVAKPVTAEELDKSINETFQGFKETSQKIFSQK